MANKRLQINLGSRQLTAWNRNRGFANDIAIVNIEGWDNPPAVRRNSAPILWAHGEAQSNDALYEARHIEITLSTELLDATEMWNLKVAFMDSASDLNARRSVTLTTYDNNGSEITREVLQVRWEDTPYEWKEINDVATVTLYFVAANPLKTLYVNGSSTPQQNGSL